MMTRGKSRVPVAPTTSTASGPRPQKHPAKSSTTSKRTSRFSDAPTASSQENSNQAASVQGSVAAVIQDIYG